MDGEDSGTQTLTSDQSLRSHKKFLFEGRVFRTNLIEKCKQLGIVTETGQNITSKSVVPELHAVITANSQPYGVRQNRSRDPSIFSRRALALSP